MGAVAVPVQYQLRPVVDDKLQHLRRIGETLAPYLLARQRRVVQVDDPEQALLPGCVEQAGQLLQLFRADRAGRHERRLGAGGGEADEGDPTAHAQAGKQLVVTGCESIRGHVVAPQ